MDNHYSGSFYSLRALREATAKEVAKFIYEEIVMQFGKPAEIVSDRGKNLIRLEALAIKYLVR